ncbi:hypothetical protein SAMN00120144_4217 [Hymenobacter roseosalivarius DSM 11622]|uniref:Uncharacterized protein n=1 Tax=Hymenobacter roseosalivarius DSM 11622 TaxID=645990 RepID=A0A1W1UG66_9BACT|nr:hypothetical protein [Hymenobacter roseosalivarius]SMB79774.1 hypothetical protein SAMN00120144_4217 [Hymenobacter roseosalivarius DSM 11622]
MTQRLFRFAYCGGVVVDSRSPLQGAYRLVSVTLVSGFLCLYFPLLWVLYALLPEAALYIPLVGIVGLAWYGLKRWQFGHLRAAQALVARCYSRRQIQYRGRAAATLGVASIWVVCLVAIGTIADYINWP